VSSVKPDGGGGEANGGKEVAGRFVMVGGDSAELLEFREKVLDQVA
jgi:hypothetical protein